MYDHVLKSCQYEAVAVGPTGKNKTAVVAATTYFILYTLYFARAHGKEQERRRRGNHYSLAHSAAYKDSWLYYER